MRSNDFEKRSEAYSYDPHKRDVKREKGVDHTFYGVVLGDPILKEIETWTNLINVLKTGLPKPFDSTQIIQKICDTERNNGSDLSALKNCCPPSSEFYEVKEFKPFIFAILERIVEIGELKKYL